MLTFLLSIGPGLVPPPPDWEPLLVRARQGDEPAREEIIRRFTPLVLRVAAQLTGRYVQVGEDDEVSVGLMALSEAIDGYDARRGAAFTAFAELVIKRRIIDHLRRQGREKAVPAAALAGVAEQVAGTELRRWEDAEAVARHAAEDERRERRAEIADFAGALERYGITFADLTACSPRHRDARQRALAAARCLAESAELRAHLLERNELPLARLAAAAGIPRKTLERQRRYIVAVALLLTGDYPHLRSYIGQAGRGE